MTKLLLIRHGEPTYEVVTKRNFKGHGRDLAALTELGRMQALEVVKDKRLEGAEIIISSPYTRALQTAAIISKETGLDIIIENDIHEWVPDLTYSYTSDEVAINAIEELTLNKGEYPNNSNYTWEPLSVLANRSISALKKYLNYKKIIVVTHAMVMRQFKFQKNIRNCEIFEIDFDENFKWNGWIENN